MGFWKWREKKEEQKEEKTPYQAINQELKKTVNNASRVILLTGQIVTSALQATKPIYEQWANITDGKAMSWMASWIVREEFLFLFLHMTDRYAYAAGGAKMRDYIIDVVVPDAIKGLVKSSFDGSQVKKGVDVKKWEASTMNETLDHFNDSSAQYALCKKLGVESKTDCLRDDTILGKVGAIINKTAFENHLIDEAFSIPLRMVVYYAAVKGLNESELKKHVEETCKDIQIE